MSSPAPLPGPPPDRPPPDRPPPAGPPGTPPGRPAAPFRHPASPGPPLGAPPQAPAPLGVPYRAAPTSPAGPGTDGAAADSGALGAGSSSTSRPARPARSVLVRAAGAVCWRRGADGIRVLVVHRPRYQDWSWPKGKLEVGERLPTTAVREVQEETGLAITLGIPLPSARYPLGTDATKHVGYWAAHVPAGETPAPPRPDEIDRTEWVSPAEAEARLTRRADRVQLRALMHADAVGVLDTWPLVVVRHGYARPKTAWGHADDERPLVAAGLRQAEALTALMVAWEPHRVVSSPWERCVATVRPYLAASGASLRTKGRLSEDGHRRDAAKSARLVAKLLAKGSAVMVCTHRPVLSTVLGTLAGHAAAGVGDLVPRTDPYLQPGEVLVAHVSRASGLVVAVERHQP